jgi:hypothetical protein
MLVPPKFYIPIDDDSSLSSKSLFLNQSLTLSSCLFKIIIAQSVNSFRIRIFLSLSQIPKYSQLIRNLVSNSENSFDSAILIVCYYKWIEVLLMRWPLQKGIYTFIYIHKNLFDEYHTMTILLLMFIPSNLSVSKVIIFINF